MGEIINATASDGHEFDIYLAQAKGSPRGGIVLVQEIFGVNNHIKNVAEKFSSNGYLVGAPSLFDRVKPDIQLGTTTKMSYVGENLKIIWVMKSH